MSFRGIGIDGMEVRHQPDGAAPPLTRQSSIYSLTFDEFHSTMGGIGKDFGSMNMEEFLKNIWTAEGSQAMASASESLALPRTLSQKTVDAVWRDINHESAGAVGGSELQQQQRQPTLGEMTLEEFLVRAGVVREEMKQSVSRAAMNSSGIPAGSNADITSNVFYGDGLVCGNNSTGLAVGISEAGRSNLGVLPNSIHGYSGANLAMPATGARSYAPQLQLGSNGMIPGVLGLGVGRVNAVASVSPANLISSDGLAKGTGVPSSLCSVPYSFNGGLSGNKCSGAVEKVVERRQKRMIKNRESAARSRARKQAYTTELEAEVAKFKEQNQTLQNKQALIMEMQKIRALEALNQQNEANKKLCLRRTQTVSW